MPFDRRTLMQSIAGAAALAPYLLLERAMAQTPQTALEAAKTRSARAHEKLAAIPGLAMHGDEEVAMLLYPGFTALDLVGPHYFFACMMGAKVHLVTNQATLDPVRSDLGLAIAPTMRLGEAPRDLAVIFAPGGTSGTLAAMEDEATIAFLRDRARRAKFVTSVCTGSLLLGKAGLLAGKRATAHWVVRDTLREFGAIPVAARVVTDGNVVTGAGVSAGLDFALALVAKLRGQRYAETLMLQAEYAPEPPFPGGALQTTDPAIASAMTEMFAPLQVQAASLASAARR